MRTLLIFLALFAIPIQPLPAQAVQKPSTPAVPERIEELLTPETIFFIVTPQLANVIENFRQLDVFHALEQRTARDAKFMAAGRSSPPVEMLRFLSFGLGEADVLNNSRLGFAFIDIGSKDGQDQAFVAFVETTDEKLTAKAAQQLVDYYSESFNHLGSYSSARKANYRGIRIERFKNGYAGAMLGAIYVFGQWPALRNVLEQRLSRDAVPLSDNPDFARSYAQLAAANSYFAYLSAEMWARYIGSNFKGAAGAFDELVKQLLDEPIRSVALGSTFEREGVVDRVLINLDPARKTAMSVLFSGPAAEFKGQKFIPAGSRVVADMSLDIGRVYDELFVPVIFGGMAMAEARDEAAREATRNQDRQPKGEAGKPVLPDPAPARVDFFRKKIIGEVEDSLGFEIRKGATRSFGNEVVFAQYLGREGGQEDAAALISLRDAAAARELIDKTLLYMAREAVGMFSDRKMEGLSAAEQLRRRAETERQAIRALQEIDREKYRDAEIISFSLGLFGPEIALTIHQEWLMLALSRDIIKRMIDTAEGGDSVLNDPDYRLATTGLTGPFQFYLDKRFFDDYLNDILKTWVEKQPDPAEFQPLNVPATIAASVESDGTSIKITSYSPPGILGMAIMSTLNDFARQRAGARPVSKPLK